MLSCKLSADERTYEIVEQQTVKDINDKDVIIPVIVARHDLRSLQQEQSELENRLSDVKAKIALIEKSVEDAKAK